MLIIGFAYTSEMKEAFILAAGCLLAALLVFRWTYIKGIWHKIVGFIILCGSTIFVLCEGCIISEAGVKTADIPEEPEYILVLGNKLDDGKINDLLYNRLDMAIAMYRQYHIPIIVSGGSADKTKPQEAAVMATYLRKFIDEEDVIEEREALDTWQNFYYTKQIIGTDKTIFVVTSDFHMFRTTFIAQEVGFDEIYGIPTETPTELVLYYHLREVVAILRELINSRDTMQ